MEFIKDSTIWGWLHVDFEEVNLESGFGIKLLLSLRKNQPVFLKLKS